MDSRADSAVDDWPDDEMSRIRRVEAILFLAREPIPSRKLSRFAGLEDGTQARTLVRQLNRKYNETGRSFSIQRVAGGFQMRTRPQFAKWIRQLEHVEAPKKLSTTQMETLAVVAYRQPIIKAEIESIRGVHCGESLRQLMDRGLVRLAGRSPELGRPFLYATTKLFLAEFGLDSLADLPRATHLAEKGLPRELPST